MSVAKPLEQAVVKSGKNLVKFGEREGKILVTAGSGVKEAMGRDIAKFESKAGKVAETVVKDAKGLKNEAVSLGKKGLKAVGTGFKRIGAFFGRKFDQAVDLIAKGLGKLKSLGRQALSFVKHDVKQTQLDASKALRDAAHTIHPKP